MVYEMLLFVYYVSYNSLNFSVLVLVSIFRASCIEDLSTKEVEYTSFLSSDVFHKTSFDCSD